MHWCADSALSLSVILVLVCPSDAGSTSSGTDYWKVEEVLMVFFPAELRHFYGLRPSRRRVPGGGLEDQQLWVVEGSEWRGRWELDSQVFCHRNLVRP